jgi:hypothetical protein
VSDRVPNRRDPGELSEADVEDAIARIGRRDPEVGQQARHVYETLTWGEGPAVLRQAGVQDWLWYRVPTKYLTDEAREASGIDPPDLADFAWGQVMGAEEAQAHATVEDALERAIAGGELVVGARGWRGRQREVTARALDGDHQYQPGQSWRTAILTERITTWWTPPDPARPSVRCGHGSGAACCTRSRPRPTSLHAWRR